MATRTHAAATALDTRDANATTHRGRTVDHNGHGNGEKTNGEKQSNGDKTNDNKSNDKKSNGAPRRRSKDSKYRHVFATHSKSSTTCLSHESEDVPSFVGFRNLMILVLSRHPPPDPPPPLTPPPQSSPTCD